jgi:hypothetical protein
MPSAAGGGRYAREEVAGVTVWRAAALTPAAPDRTITIGLGRLLFFRPRLFVTGAGA